MERRGNASSDPSREETDPCEVPTRDSESSGAPAAGPDAIPTQTAGPAGATSEPSPDLPTAIGRYRVLGKLGEGGMGVVYEAEQQSPHRKVAVKVVRGGQFVDDARVRMFQREADTLARLKHPNIGTIYESGRTEDGQHFFAMELVRGDTLDAYLEKRPKAVTAEELPFRLALFRKIADAVHYAHQRGVIHRDLKPSNIVVTEEAAREDSPSSAGSTLSGQRLPEIKILDFGLARITEGDVAAATMMTEVGAIKGTLPYMSPEQARGNSEQIDVRTDVYALGVILYEMLAGRRPYDVVKKSLVEAVRVICEEPPQPLRQTMSGVRRLDPDVETIVGKALEKEVDRRYASASALSEDVARYLTSQPIQARPPSTTYQLRKFAARNRALVGGVVATILVLAAGIVVSTVFGLRAESRRKEAEWRSYVGNLAAAEASLRVGGVSSAKRRLAACPTELRGVEWSYLQAQTETSRATLAGHEGAVSSVAFSADGTRLVSGSEDKTVRLWDGTSGKLLATLAGHEGAVSSVAFSPDGTRVVSGCWDKAVRLWDARSGSLLATLAGHEGAVSSVAFSADGTRLVSGSADKTVRLWDGTSGKLLATLTGHDETVFSVVFSPDGTRVASGSSDKTVRLWDTVSGRPVATLTGRANVLCLAFNPDGARLASGAGDGTICLWDVLSGKLLETLQGYGAAVHSIAFSPDGTRLVSGSYDNTLRLWNVASGAMLGKLTGHAGTVYAVAFSPDGTRLASGSADRTVRLWNAVPSEFQGRLPGGWAASVAFSPDGTDLASGSLDKTVRLWDVASGDLLATLNGHGAQVGSVAFSPDGTRLVSGSADRTVRLWEVASGDLLATLVGHEGEVERVTFSPDGMRLASGSDDKTVRLWDSASGKLLATLAGHEGAVYSVAFSPDGTRLVSGSDDKTVRLWDPASGKLRATLAGHKGAVISVAFSPDGTRLVSGSADGSIRLWRLPSGKPMATLAEHEGIVTSVAFSRDGTRLVSGSFDATVRLWDAASGELLATLPVVAGPVASVALSRDGTHLAAGCEVGIRLWKTAISDDAQDRAAIALFLERVGGHAEAERVRRAAVESLRQSGTAGSDSDLGAAQDLLGANLNHQGKYAEAEPFLLEATKILRGDHAPDTWRIPQARSLLGQSLAGQGRHVEAEPLLVGGLAGLLAALNAPLEARCHAIDNIAGAHPGVRAASSTTGLALATAALGEAPKHAGTHLAKPWAFDFARDLDAPAKERFARLMLACSPGDRGYADSALGLALDAERMSAKPDARLLETIGLAYQRAGEPLKAVEYERRALSLLPEGPSLDRTRLEYSLSHADASQATPVGH